jgi:hypothetical protein
VNLIRYSTVQHGKRDVISYISWPGLSLQWRGRRIARGLLSIALATILRLTVTAWRLLVVIAVVGTTIATIGLVRHGVAFLGEASPTVTVRSIVRLEVFRLQLARASWTAFLHVFVFVVAGGLRAGSRAISTCLFRKSP